MAPSCSSSGHHVWRSWQVPSLADSHRTSLGSVALSYRKWKGLCCEWCPAGSPISLPCSRLLVGPPRRSRQTQKTEGRVQGRSSSPCRCVGGQGAWSGGISLAGVVPYCAPSCDPCRSPRSCSCVVSTLCSWARLMMIKSSWCQ